MITLNAERKTWHKILFWCISSLNPCLLMTKSISEKVTEIVLHLMISSFHLCLLHDVNKATYIKTSRFQDLSTKVMGQIWVFSEDAREEEAQCKDMLSYIFKSTVFFFFLFENYFNKFFLEEELIHWRSSLAVISAVAVKMSWNMTFYRTFLMTYLWDASSESKRKGNRSIYLYFFLYVSIPQPFYISIYRFTYLPLATSSMWLRVQRFCQSLDTFMHPSSLKKHMVTFKVHIRSKIVFYLQIHLV